MIDKDTTVPSVSTVEGVFTCAFVLGDSGVELWAVDEPLAEEPRWASLLFFPAGMLVAGNLKNNVRSENTARVLISSYTSRGQKNKCMVMCFHNISLYITSFNVFYKGNLLYIFFSIYTYKYIKGFESHAKKYFLWENMFTKNIFT